jgi:hypothetical protein
MGGRLQISNAAFTDNTVTTYSGGGMFVVDGTQATLANSRVSDNQATNTPGPTLGGGILLESAEFTITRSGMSGNSTPDGGGGPAVYESTGVLTLDSAARILNNTTVTIPRGEILLTGGGNVNLNGATLDGNIPDNVRTNQILLG